MMMRNRLTWLFSWDRLGRGLLALVSGLCVVGC